MSENGIDYDLRACWENNELGFSIDAIQRVLAVWEGKNDGDDWRWIVELCDMTPQYAFIRGGCDYTGWDCQSWAQAFHVDDVQWATMLAFVPSAVYPNGETSDDNSLEVFTALKKQIVDGVKALTWSERTDDALGNPPRIDAP